MTQVYSPSQLVFALNSSLPEASNVFVDVGQNAVALALGLMRNGGQRLFSSWANSPMGYSLPAAIGAAVSSPESLPVCVIGDGGIRTALSSLPNLRKFSGQLKVIVWDNGGYGTIIDHIDRVLGRVRTAVDEASGLAHFPMYDVFAAAGVTVDLAEGDLVSRMSAFFQASNLDVLIVPVDPDYRMVSLPEIADEPAESSPKDFLRQEH
jgi:acetolactate synthase-1/2/3 large subunit